MTRILITLALLLFFSASNGEAGWFNNTLQDLGQAVQDAGKQVTDQFVNDTGQAANESASSAYQDTKEAAGSVGSQDTDDSSPPESEPQEEQQLEAQSSPSDFGSDGKKRSRNYSHEPVRSDLQFTADTEMIDADDPANLGKGKMYVDGARVRHDMNTSDGRISTIITGAKPDDNIYMLMHEQKSYMTSPVGDAEDDLWGALRGADNPCEGYRKSKNLGQKTVNGRKTVQWSCSDPEDQDDPASNTLWIDGKLHIPVKMEDGDGGSYELKNIKEGKPAADKFKIPAGYREITVFGQTGHVSTGSESAGGKQAAVAMGGALPDDLKAILAKAKVPIYPGSVFCIGSTSAGIRFATSDSVDKVRKWYRSQRSQWALIDEPKYQIWVLYEGAPGIGMMEWLNYNMAAVNENKELPGWHGLSKDMTTEIVLGVADKYK